MSRRRPWQRGVAWASVVACALAAGCLMMLRIPFVAERRELASPTSRIGQPMSAPTASASGGAPVPYAGGVQESTVVSSTSSAVVLDPDAAEQRLRDAVQYLASDELQGRGVGTRGIDLAGQYIAQQFADAGLRTNLYHGKPFQEFSFSQHASQEGQHKGMTTRNVVAILDGQGPLAGEAIVLGAHYDHLGMGGVNSLAPGKSAIHNGADDNASGTAVLMEVARRLYSARAAPSRSIVFIAFSGEELGLLGSRRYVEHPLVPVKETVAMFNFDMVGRLRRETLYVCGTESAAELDSLVTSLAGKHGFRLRKYPAALSPSDHWSFYLAGMPVLHFFTGLHHDYHRPSDDYELLDYAGMRRIAEFSSELVMELATAQARPRRVDPFEALVGTVPLVSSATSRTSHRQGYLGVLADPNHTQAGFAVLRVIGNSPAEKAGLRPADVILQMADTPIRQSEDLRPCVRRMNPGERASMIIARDGTHWELEVTLGAR